MQLKKEFIYDIGALHVMQYKHMLVCDSFWLLLDSPMALEIYFQPYQLLHTCIHRATSCQLGHILKSQKLLNGRFHLKPKHMQIELLHNTSYLKKIVDYLKLIIKLTFNHYYDDPTVHYMDKDTSSKNNWIIYLEGGTLYANKPIIKSVTSPIGRVGGILWKRANRYGAFAAVIISFGLYYYLNFQNTGELLLVYKWKPEPFGWAMLAGFASLIFVSLIGKPENKERMEHFFDNMRRVSDAAGLAVGQEKPLAADHGKDLVFLDLPGWLRADRWQGFFHRYREDVLGFFYAWAVVGMLILLAWSIMQIGK